jgi:hypothetical protein
MQRVIRTNRICTCLCWNPRISFGFVLQHSGTTTRGAPQLTVTVVPASGTGGRLGLAGKMTIKIADGKHFYEFDFTLCRAQAQSGICEQRCRH